MFDLAKLAPPRETALALPPATARPVDPNGWDVVSAVRIDEMNAAIRNAGTSPEGFEATPAAGATVKGRFDPWSVAPDGSGLLINLAVPLRDVTVSLNGKDGHIDAATAIVRVELEYIPAGARMMARADGTEAEVETHLLVLRTQLSPHRLMADPGHRVAHVLSIDGGREIGTRLYSALMVGLDQWFNENLAAFQHVFATVNIVKNVSEDTKGGFNWMQPSAVSYAFGHNSSKPGESVLAILCQTGGRKADGLVAQAQADMVPEGATAALCISRQRIAHEMIAKALPLAFDGLEEKHLVFRAKDTQVATTRDIPLKDVKDPDSGKTYSPVLKTLEILVSETDVRVDSVTETEITPGIWSVVNTTDKFRYGLTTNKKGQKTIGFNRFFHDPRTSTRKDEAATILEWIARALALVGTIALTYLSGGAFLVVLAITAALTIGVVTRGAIELVQGGDGPSIDLLLTNATHAVSWSTAKRFDPVFAALNGGLQIGGILGGTDRLMTAEGEASAQADFQAPFRALMAARAAGGRS